MDTSKEKRREKHKGYALVNFALERMLHCNEDPIYVFLFWELGGLSLNFRMHVSVSDLYFPMIYPLTVFPAAEYADRSCEYINRLTDT